ncbi:transglycosylase SLT domain-containing protein [Mycolicibacterium arenosum]|uniref:Transglycosylase SLT domain-containing protein n=1 Tax=Mycolicibacterium arenosum TaxID=2952157 RepID=A0ABT1ME44_9MYCO|nr:transglycosylase SLT domain-containing protein [Mycolicibacterium sp. CAU 1645]MCP9276479.1 transglycosylase SLT domain-containing protein [Mycolicibacterium sp. CAU 1645]
MDGNAVSETPAVSLEGFVRSAGAAMGVARESFGVGALPAPPAGVGLAPNAFGDGAGRAADAFATESAVLDDHVRLLTDQDTRGDDQLHAALDAAGNGRGRMDAVIDAAVGDVTAMGASTDTPEGRAALIAAIKRHLEDTRGTLDTAAGDAATRAASAGVTAAGYDAVGNPIGTTTSAATPVMAPPSGMPSTTPMPSMPALPMSGGTPMSGPAGFPLGNLPGLFTGTTRAEPGVVPSRAVGGGSPAAAIGLDDVRFERHDLPGGRAAYRGYIGAALDVMGIEDPAARARWTRGLETALARESAFNPHAVNLSDPNAIGARLVDGAPSGSSRGGLQMIPATFASNHQPGTSTNIYDPVANLSAAMNYLMRRYHVRPDGTNLVSVAQFDPHQNGQGY